MTLLWLASAPNNQQLTTNNYLSQQPTTIFPYLAGMPSTRIRWVLPLSLLLIIQLWAGFPLAAQPGTSRIIVIGQTRPDSNYVDEEYGDNPLRPLDSLRQYIGVKGSVGQYWVTAMPDGSGPILANSIGIYRASNNPFYIQPELSIAYLSQRLPDTVYAATSAQLAILPVLDLKYVNFKGGITLDLFEVGPKMKAGLGAVIGFGIRVVDFDFEVRGAISGNSNYGMGYFGFSAGYLLPFPDMRIKGRIGRHR